MGDWFYDQLLKGNIFKELVRILLEKSDYLVIPYGYENPFANVKNKLRKALEDSSPTEKRIRYSPDLLVYNNDTQDIKLVEVKMSSYPNPPIKQIEYYQQYWNDSVLVYVLPTENVFYAQEVSKLGRKDKYDPESDFKPIKDIFPRISDYDIKRYGNVARKLIEATKTLYKPSKIPEKVEDQDADE